MKILFQGDSITDSGRIREKEDHMGVGYPMLIKASLGFEAPGKYEFFNKGIGGNRVVDVYARIKRDFINIRPDIISILVGVNDVWHEFKPSPNGVDAEKFYKIYDMLITEIKEELPDVKMMILEPFVLKAHGTEENWDVFRPEVEKRAEMARKIAEKHNILFVPLQKGFDKLSEKTGANYWLEDGVHPTPMGHEYIKTEWIKAFKKL
ncbi:MAG: SGNH/GDSL hydrolase family protein [Clostridia bacterium]|nr:SGNH/GDSL hydrolase family protein [Clostridia bacterium]